MKSAAMEQTGLIIEKPSKSGFDRTVKDLISEAERRDWKVPFVHDLRQSLAKSGKSVKPVKVIEICKPEYSGQMLEKNHERIMSVMMPCRISVYEKDDGKTYVAILNGDKIATGLPKVIAGIMAAASDETLDIVRTVVG